MKEDLPENFQTSEYVQKCGFVDLIVERKDLNKKIGTLLSILLINSSKCLRKSEILLVSSPISSSTTSPAFAPSAALAPTLSAPLKIFLFFVKKEISKFLNL